MRSYSITFYVCPLCRRRTGTVVALAANMACALSVLLQPYMPHVSDVIQQQLQASARINIISGGLTQFLPAGHRIGKVRTLHPAVFTSGFFRSSDCWFPASIECFGVVDN